MWTSIVELLVIAAPALVAEPTWAQAHLAVGGETPRAFRDAVEAAAATDAGLLVITPGGVKVLDGSGRLLRSYWTAGGRLPGQRSAAPRPASPGWPGLTADTDFTGAAYDPDDIDDADDPRLADDANARPWDIDEAHVVTPSGRRAFGGPPPRPLVAAVGEAGWVLRDDGVWKVGLRDGMVTRVYAGDGRRVRALAAGGTPGTGTTVALVDGDQVLRARSGQPFEPIGDPVAGIRALGILAAGGIAVLDGTGRLRAYAGPEDGGTTLFNDAVDDLVTCSPDVLVLRDAAVFVMNQAGVQRVGSAPPGTERLGCGDESSGWAAFGRAIHVSADRGATWMPRPSSPIRPIRALLPTRTALWIAVPPGLWPLPPIEQPGERVAAMGVAAPPSTDSISGHRPETVLPRSAFSRRWATLLPEVDIDLELGRLGPVREVRGMVAASWRLDGLWSGLVPLRPRRGRVWDGRPDVGLTTQLDALAVNAGEAIAADERRALARILEESP